MRIDPGRLTGECPTVVGMMTSSLESGGSLDVAVRYIAENGPSLSRILFSKAVSLVDTKSIGSIRESLSSVIGELPKQAGGYSRAVIMCISASEASDEREMSRMLDDAANTGLDAVRILGETYSSSLNFPNTAVFAIGIMVPMILMSLLPVLSIGGMFGAGTIDERLVVVTTLVLIPLGIRMMCSWIRSRNPFRAPGHTSGYGSALPLLITLPMMVVHSMLGMEPDGILLFSVAPASVVTIICIYGDHVESRRRSISVDAMMESISDIGNRMLAGENFEDASVISLKGKPQCSHIGESLEKELMLCRGDVSSAIRRSVACESEEVSVSLDDIRACSEDNTEDAGRLAVTLGRQYQNRNSTMMELESKLKSMTDMMFATAAIFAPMVLGLSVSMFEPLSALAGGSGLENTPLILGTYLVELCALISLLTSSFGRNGSFHDVLWRFCMMCPLSLLVFTVCCGVSL